MKRGRAAAALAAVILLSGCIPRASRPPVVYAPPIVSQPIVPPVLAPPANAIAAGVTPSETPVSVEPGAAARALTAFRASCPALLRRTDQSGLTINSDWQDVCRAAATAIDASAFFRDRFDAVRVGNGAAFATGYYEPEIAGSRVPIPGYATPLYRVPDDLVSMEVPGDCTVQDPAVPCKPQTARGRTVDGAFTPFYDRAQIEDGALTGRGLELAWAADPIEAFFLEVQGSGRLRLPDGGVMRIGYAGQNGFPYTGIGALMNQRGLLGPTEHSMQGIMGWLRAHPEEGRAIMRENRSVVFFREITGPGPVGAMNVAVVAKASVAADPSFVPLGAPVILSMDRGDASGLWVAQDTGGAIRGANRFDTFWGAGAEARVIAGGMSARGTALILLPRGVVARIAANGGAAPKP